MINNFFWKKLCEEKKTLAVECNFYNKFSINCIELHLLMLLEICVDKRENECNSVT